MDFFQYGEESLDAFALKLGRHFPLEAIASLNRIPEQMIWDWKMRSGGHELAAAGRGTALPVESQIIFCSNLTFISRIGISAAALRVPVDHLVTTYREMTTVDLQPSIDRTGNRKSTFAEYCAQQARICRMQRLFHAL